MDDASALATPPPSSSAARPRNADARLDDHRELPGCGAPRGLPRRDRALLGAYRGRNAFEGFTTERVYTLVGRGPYSRISPAIPGYGGAGRFLKPNSCSAPATPSASIPARRPVAAHRRRLLPRAGRRPAIGSGDRRHRRLHRRERRHLDNPRQPSLEPAGGLSRPARPPTGWGEKRADARAGNPGRAPPSSSGALVPSQPRQRPPAAPRARLHQQMLRLGATAGELLSVGAHRERVRPMSPALQGLLGYSISPTFLGMVTGSHPAKSLEEDWIPPGSSASPGTEPNCKKAAPSQARPVHWGGTPRRAIDV